MFIVGCMPGAYNSPLAFYPPESSDVEFDDYQRNFAILETAAEKFLKDTKAFTDAVNSMCHFASSSHTVFSITLRQLFSRPGAASPSTFLSSSIPSHPNMTFWEIPRSRTHDQERRCLSRRFGGTLDVHNPGD